MSINAAGSTHRYRPAPGSVFVARTVTVVARGAQLAQVSFHFTHVFTVAPDTKGRIVGYKAGGVRSDSGLFGFDPFRHARGLWRGQLSTPSFWQIGDVYVFDDTALIWDSRPARNVWRTTTRLSLTPSKSRKLQDTCRDTDKRGKLLAQIKVKLLFKNN